MAWRENRGRRMSLRFLAFVYSIIVSSDSDMENTW